MKKKKNIFKIDLYNINLYSDPPEQIVNWTLHFIQRKETSHNKFIKFRNEVLTKINNDFTRLPDYACQLLYYKSLNQLHEKSGISYALLHAMKKGKDFSEKTITKLFIYMTRELVPDIGGDIFKDIKITIKEKKENQTVIDLTGLARQDINLLMEKDDYDLEQLSKLAIEIFALEWSYHQRNESVRMVMLKRCLFGTNVHIFKDVARFIYWNRHMNKAINDFEKLFHDYFREAINEFGNKLSTKLHWLRLEFVSLKWEEYINEEMPFNYWIEYRPKEQKIISSRMQRINKKENKGDQQNSIIFVDDEKDVFDPFMLKKEMIVDLEKHGSNVSEFWDDEEVKNIWDMSEEEMEVLMDKESEDFSHDADLNDARFKFLVFVREEKEKLKK